MTRINLVPPEELSDKHLSGEFHEISRVFNLVRKSPHKPGPQAYTLGTGHVRFFYRRLGFISERYVSLALEIRYRGRPYSQCDLSRVVRIVQEARRDIPEDYWGDYTPTPEALLLNRERIRERS